MEKPFLLLRGPVETRSGYGAHAKDLLKSLYDMDMFDIKIDSTNWGNTPKNALDLNKEFDKWVKANIVTTLESVPDIYIQVTIPNEFKPIGKYNIGVTAGIETSAIPKDWVDGCNKMDSIIVPSNFSKEVIMSSVYNETDNVSKKLIRQYKVEKPLFVLFEGVNTEVYTNTADNDCEISKRLDTLETDFNYLFVGHWLKGDIGEDRKDVGKLIQTFIKAFQGKEDKPGLILKTSSATFSVIQREEIITKIKDAVGNAEDAPPIYLLFGDLTDEEMNSLYNHEKVKAMVTATKGEGFGRPLLEFTMTGKPVVATNWSGHKDFLPINKSFLVGGKLTEVHESATDDYIIKGTKWFTANYGEMVMLLRNIKEDYPLFEEKAKELMMENTTKFSLDRMTEKFKEILEINLDKPKQVKLNLPKLEKK